MRWELVLPGICVMVPLILGTMALVRSRPNGLQLPFFAVAVANAGIFNAVEAGETRLVQWAVIAMLIVLPLAPPILRKPLGEPSQQ
jgi:hypothetical protein